MDAKKTIKDSEAGTQAEAGAQAQVGTWAEAGNQAEAGTRRAHEATVSFFWILGPFFMF